MTNSSLKRNCLWLAISLAASVFSLLYSEYSVSDVVYSPYGPTMSNVTVSPAAACIGDSVTISGIGPATVSVVMTYHGNLPVSVLEAGLGEAPVNIDGKWSLTVIVPETGTEIVIGENNQVASIHPASIIPGTYTITASDNQGLEFLASGTLEVLNCSNSGIGMPSTGLPTVALALLAGAGLIAFTGAALGLRKNKS